MMKYGRNMFLVLSFVLYLFWGLSSAEEENLIQSTEVVCAFGYDGDDFCWFHPRVATVPIIGTDGYPRVVMTVQKHLRASDYYSEMYISFTDNGGKTWAEPTPIPELGWGKDDRGNTISVCDVTPGWHPKRRSISRLVCVSITTKRENRFEKAMDVWKARTRFLTRKKASGRSGYH